MLQITKDLIDHFKKKAKELNWIIMILVIVLSYGFLLTNQSIGTDDENFDFYFKNNGIVASGRWGSWLLGTFLDTYSYLPVWRDMIAIVVLIVAVIIFLCICENVRNEKLDAIGSVIVCSVIITYPIIAKMFIYIDNSLETSLCIMFATLAAYSLMAAKNVPKRSGYMAMLVFLILGCSLIENTLIYFCIEICFFSLLQADKDNFFWDIVIPVCACVAAMAAVKFLGHVIADALGIIYSDYGMGSYYKWDTIKSMGDLREAFTLTISNFNYWFTKYFSVKLFAISGFFWIVTAVYSCFKKHILKAVYAIGIIFASFAMYFITACGNLPLRIFTSYFISVAGAIIYIYWIIDHLGKEQYKKVIKAAFVFACAFCIFYQTKESNEYYQLDYKRFLRDQDVAKTVNYDLEKMVGITPDLPVLFLGQPEQYGDMEIEGEVALATIYSNNQDGESIRIHRFFSMLGYEYPDVIDGEITIFNMEERKNSHLITDAKVLAAEMPCYPYDGYIRVLDDKIIIKLGNIE